MLGEMLDRLTGLKLFTMQFLWCETEKQGSFALQVSLEVLVPNPNDCLRRLEKTAHIS